MELQDLAERPKTRWVPLYGHLAGVELLIRCVTPEESQKFSSRLRRQGITRAKGDHPFDIADGRETAFFREFAAQYVMDWRGQVTLNGQTYTANAGPTSEDVGKFLGGNRAAFDAVVTAAQDDGAFFESGPSA